MVYVSIDIETSGLDFDMNSILSIGAIIEDTTKKLPFEECPKFNAIVLQRNIQGSPRALTMNKNIIELMSEYLDGNDEVKQNMNTQTGYLFLEEEEVVKQFYRFLYENGLGDHTILNSGGYGEFTNGKWSITFNNATKPITLNVAGKNFGTFDKVFLEELPWWKKLIRIRQRILDPGILFVDWNNDDSIPNLKTCKERCNVNGEVTHDALEDAWDVIQILRTKY
jgi:oligoribonuclease